MDSAVLESVTEPNGKQGATQDEEEDTSVMTSMTLLEASECLDKLQTFPVKQEVCQIYYLNELIK
jgi:hypothetical protein